MAIVLLSFGLAGQAQAQINVAALTSTGGLVFFNSGTPGTITSSVAVTGLNSGDSLVAIDYRPIDQQLVGLGYNANTGLASVYTITPAGAATSINGNVLSLGTGTARVTADFNPTANALRIVTSSVTGNNRRIPTGGTGALANDTDLNPANSGIRSTAYSRNNPGGGTSGATTLYEIDGTNNQLVSQGSIDFFTGSGTSPNTGTLTNVAALTGITGSSVVGFDIVNAPGTAATSQGAAYLADSNTFYLFNLNTGAATSVGTIGSGLTITDIAVVAVPEPGTLLLGGLAAGSGALVYLRTRKKRKTRTAGKR